jgi:hypothetical protein
MVENCCQPRRPRHTVPLPQPTATSGRPPRIGLHSGPLVAGVIGTNKFIDDLAAQHFKDLKRPQHIFQLVVADLPADFPPLRSPETRHTNLPPSHRADRTRARASWHPRDLVPHVRAGADADRPRSDRQDTPGKMYGFENTPNHHRAPPKKNNTTVLT